MSKSIIISPSGNLYGSEHVLLEFLKNSEKHYSVYVPKNSLLYNELLKEEYNYAIKTFSNLPWLYLKVLSKLLFINRSLYVNEGGHVRYIKLLAKILPFRKFHVHIRLLEDCSAKRLNKIPKNVKIIAVSNYIKNNISQKEVQVLYDPYTTNAPFKKKQNSRNESEIRIGIVGRLTATKGLDQLFPILDAFENKNENKIKLVFFGSFNKEDPWTNEFFTKLNSYQSIKYELAGFISDKNEIYSKVHLVLHLNKVEALGRIIFESIDFDVPILAFNAGGCGELLNKLELNNFLISADGQWPEACKAKIIENTTKFPINAILKAKEIIYKDFNAANYVSRLEAILKD